MRKVWLNILGLTTLVAFQSCDGGRVFEENHAIDGLSWKASDVQSFKFKVEEDIASANLYVNVRNTGDYQFSNLYIFVSATFPEQNHYRDTIECILAYPSGKWKGEGLGDIIDASIMFKHNISLPSGEYEFTLEQAMRTESLAHISDIGLRVEQQ